MTVAHVLAEAHVGDDEQVGRGVLYGSCGELNDALGVVGPARGLVLVIRDAEEQYGRYAEVVSPRSLFDGVVYGELENTRHRGYGVLHVLPRRYEDRVDEVLGREPRLTHQAPQSGRAPRSS